MLKLNNRVLLIVLAVLVAIWLGREFLTNKGESNFSNEVLAFDKALADKLLVTPKNQGEVITFQKTGTGWQVSQAAITDEADEPGVNSMLNALFNLQAERLVSRTESSWEKYEVDEGKSTRVRVFDGAEELADVYVGKFTFQQSGNKSMTFVRKAGASDVYAIPGFFASNFTKEFKSFRDKTFLKTSKENIRKIQFTYPSDSSFTLSRTQEKWMLGDIPADSTAVEGFLNGLSNMTKSDFDDEFSSDDQSPAYRLTIDGNNMSSITIDAYSIDENDYILHSSLNPNAWFRKGTLDIFDELFVSKSKFRK